MKMTSKLLAGIAPAIVTSGAFAADAPYVEGNVQAFLDQLAAGGGTPIEQLSPKDARGVLSGAQSSVEVDLSGITVEAKTITIDGEQIDLRIVRPEGIVDQLPAFMFFHGGGWVLGDFPTHERLIRDLVVNSGAVAVYVDYTRSPEAQYPVAINQAYRATRWVAEHGDEINVDGSRLAVAGNSVGGNMATVVSLMAKENGTPQLRYQALLWPVTDASFDTDSYNQFDQGYFLTKPMMEWFWDNYTTDPEERDNIHASPLRASLDQLKGLPPALVQTASNDVLRDEGETYAAKLDAAGVPVTAVRYEGMIHDYGLLNPLSDVPEVQAAMRQAGEELKVHLK
ncbi:MAG: alpha/beta hydrolase [Salinicola sp.]|uniref:alpha/beta hydrolase n=1 Tax=Salinicola sp. TaxID=1978524 RepID=UPI001DA1F8E8|nr:alpha/beta hydrolase [Salinicola sp.]NRB55995.1 alpha/beta hydrolase [Salinicola sp.]